MIEQANLAAYTPTPMTPREQNLLRTLRTHLYLEKQDTFTVDTLRMLGFDRYMPLDKQNRHNYGSFFIKLKHFKEAEPCGWKPSEAESNHGRKVQVWRIKQP